MKKIGALGIGVIALVGILLVVLAVWRVGPKVLSVANDRQGEAAAKSGEHTDRGHAHDEEGKGEHKSGHGEDEHKDEKLVRLSGEEVEQFGIEVDEARSGMLGTELSLPGEVTANADRMAHIVPRLPGVVREVKKNVGDTVRQGELMAVIASRELADAKAEYLAAAERVVLDQARFSREERLWRKKISAEQDYLDARQALAESRIKHRSAEQKLHALGLSDAYIKALPRHADKSYTRYEIIAPFDGTVIEKHITLGEVLKEDAEAFRIVDLGTVWVDLNMHQKDFPLVQKGQKVKISAGYGIPDAEGVISYVGPLIKEETRTALARVILPNHQGNWRPGMFVTAKMRVDGLTAPVVLPKAVLQTMEGQTVVFVRTEEGFIPKPVTVGQTNETSVEITSGLSPGERYVAKGSFTLKGQLSKGAFSHSD